MLRKLLDAQSPAMRIGQKVLPLDKAVPLQLFEKSDVPPRITWTKVQATEAIGPTHLLRASRERPRRRTTEQRDEFAALHSMTSSARASSVGGTSSPSSLPVLRLITSSNLVGSWTGRSAGFVPF